MANRIFRMAAIAGMIFLVAGVTAWAQTAQPPQPLVHKEMRVTNENGVVTVTASGEPQTRTSTFTFVASEMGFESKVVKGVPFSADTVSEFTQVLGNGQRLYRSSSGALYRDSDGRTRREQTIDAIGPYAASMPVKKTIMINDPVAGESYVLNPEDHVAVKTMSGMISGSAGGAIVTYSVKSGDPGQTHVSSERIVIDGVKSGTGVGAGIGVGAAGAVTKVVTSDNVRTEPLGTQIIEGISAEGTKTIETIPAGSIGNDTPIEIISERWYSEELGMVVKTVRNDPLSGQNIYQLKNIRRSEPAPDLFQVPADYTVKDTHLTFQTIKK